MLQFLSTNIHHLIYAWFTRMKKELKKYLPTYILTYFLLIIINKII